MRALFVIGVALVAIAALSWSQWSVGDYRISGIVEVDEIRVGSRVGGRVAKVHILEGQRVSAQQPLVELEPFDLNERIAEAGAALAARRATLARLETGFREEEKLQAAARRDKAAATLAKLQSGPRPLEIQILRDRAAVAKADVDHAEAEYERVKRLFEGAVGATQEMDDATRGLIAARARYAAAEDELKLALEGTRSEEITEARALLADAEAALQMMNTGARQEDIAEARALLESSEAAVATLERQRSELTVRSPGECIVEATDLQPGDLIPANSPVLTLVDPARLFIRAYVPENRDVKVGDVVSVRIDAYPNRRYAGEVLFVSRRGEFTPNNAQTPEERSKQVFRIRMLLREGQDVLRAGMSADVFLDHSQ